MQNIKYTLFDKTKQVLCVMQVVDDAVSDETGLDTVMGHSASEVIDIDEGATTRGASRMGSQTNTPNNRGGKLY